MTLNKNASGEYIFRNPKWTTDNTIYVEVEHDELGWIPFNATPYDEMDYGRELFELLSVKYADQVEACPESRYYEEAKSDVNDRRNRELAASDWIMAVDSQVANQNEWIVYRQALRDITDQEGYPYEAIFPDKPDYIKA